jgi:hypothetical protein
MVITRLKMGAESKDPEDFYCTQDRFREFDQHSLPQMYSVFMPETAWLRSAAAPAGRDTMVAPGVSPG